MKAIVARSAVIFCLGFFGLFLLRLGYGYVDQPNGEVIQRGFVDQSLGYDFELSRKNYAGQKQSVGGGTGPASVDQRYEKVATLGQSSDAFDEDEAKVRSVAKAAQALVQHEQAFGLKGRRQLQLALGVPPAAFDDVIIQIREIGEPVSFQVNKTDKTNEYRALLAQQESLRKSRDNLLELKVRDAELDDLIALESRILDLENQIQSLGVSVGEFDSEFEFVTIKLTLSEVRPPVERFIPFLKRAKAALEWTVYASLGIAAALFFFVTAAVLFVLLLQMVRRAMPAEGQNR
ncbi:DUF4349 domain-containing protein [Alisedimentitalea sp. MJ-SS2]|uniref:DUF4349 domain-containing protein n=1 Tax=Aliisedimentitalea sp. MJ-SS2 TaxID=3049795 RepID=UPI002906F44D|nr:DUF4349 domain-containing protein [Alisedimentitalea sp. MJ-SS2]MDU8927490.1 DUF4349 domain-containing protein [Alisedimentitalea sp. MJ-SS2]